MDIKTQKKKPKTYKTPKTRVDWVKKKGFLQILVLNCFVLLNIRKTNLVYVEVIIHHSGRQHPGYVIRTDTTLQEKSFQHVGPFAVLVPVSLCQVGNGLGLAEYAKVADLTAEGHEVDRQRDVGEQFVVRARLLVLRLQVLPHSFHLRQLLLA